MRLIPRKGFAARALATAAADDDDEEETLKMLIDDEELFSVYSGTSERRARSRPDDSAA
jgi:hypothetical protein